jgi:N-glycosylase/DNA lyase
VVCAESRIRTFAVQNYALGMTLTSGQAFRWREDKGDWIGVVKNLWVRLRTIETGIVAETAVPVDNWSWLEHYLQIDLDLSAILNTFPLDEPMRAAVAACHGLRLLRQDPWECLASFILSSTKQILQIQQIVSLLCEQYGQRITVGAGYPAAWSFPGPERLATLNEADLRACKMGFRAPYLLSAARAVTEGKVDLRAIADLPLDAARVQLLSLEGVGPKICHCVLLFAYGRQEAFPVDVWVMKALQQLYFPKRKRTLRQLQEFAVTHFGSNAGYAQQYLFHYARSHMRRRNQNPS